MFENIPRAPLDTNRMSVPVAVIVFSVDVNEAIVADVEVVRILPGVHRDRVNSRR